MTTFFMLCAFFGYGAGYEGCYGTKHHIGIYTPDAEYGWVVSEEGIYLNTILYKVKNNS